MALHPRRPRRFVPALVLAAAACSAGGSASRPAPAPAPASAPAPARAPAPANTPASTALPEGLRLETSEAFMRAVSRGTRTMTGAPGPNYWQQYAKYKLEADLNPTTKRLTGRGHVTYFNHSPDTLPVLYVQAYQNLFRPDAKRVTQTPKLGGIEWTRVAVGGRDLPANPKEREPGYTVNGTIMELRLPKPLPPGGTAELDFAWNFRVQSETAPRGGQDSEVWFISYWYPQMAVYDDVNGWQIDQYLGRGEFYMGYADYDVTLHMPAGWLVQATGTLQNPREVFSPQTLARLDSARTSPTVFNVVTDKDRADSTALAKGQGGKLVWKFRADSVRDVVFGTSPRYNWDVAWAVVDSASGRPDTVQIDAFYRTEGKRSYWDEAARYGKFSIEFFSKLLWPYRYQHMSAFDGPVGCGGMEYPMMTCIGGQWDSTSMFEVVTHEIGHMWFPMMVGSDEKRFGWMDEGFTQYDQSQSMDAFFKDFDDEKRNRDNYLQVARAGAEEPSMKQGDRYDTEYGFGVGTYYKPASVLVALRQMLGRETFEQAFREYGRRWRNKHPMPSDFFNTVNQVSGRDLSWFWRQWFFETRTLDQGIESVATVGDSTAIAIENKGRAVMPVPLAISREGGKVDSLMVPASVWFDGTKRYVVKVAGTPKVTRVEIDPSHAFPDVNPSNNAWPRGQAVER
ncbi:MAG TPA: M1 family metallopeptidase [Gemmatimonadales bacterium]|nr:M1 family metallopeptidase [Gemmatimonadales bacterium]